MYNKENLYAKNIFEVMKPLKMLKVEKKVIKFDISKSNITLEIQISKYKGSIV
jgi:hypothetical protein